MCSGDRFRQILWQITSSNNGTKFSQRLSFGVRQRHLVKELITSRLPTLAVEHIGSTAVPGCAGKGIVDLMVIYPDGQLPVVKDLLDRGGFQRQTVGFLWPEDRPMRVGAITFDGSTFPVHVHVLEHSSLEAAQLCAFCQRLQADPDLIASYVARKKEIVAGTVTDPAEYTHLKGEFIRRVLADG